MENYDFENDTMSSNEQSVPNQAQQQPEDFAQQEPKKKSLFNIMWVYYGVGGLVGLFAVYMFYTILFPSKPEPVSKPKPAIERSFQSVAPPQPKLQTIKVAQSAESSQMSASMQQAQLDTKQALNEVARNLKAEAEFVSDGMKRLNAQQQEIADEITRLSKVVQSLSQNMAEVQKGVEEANSKVKHMANLQTSLSNVSQQLAMLQAERTNMSDPLELSAVMPNRAWLQNSKGSTIAVTVGSQLKGYGSITKIDSETNKVYTSSGYVFE